MLRALTILLSFQLVGEVVGRGLSLPIPGPVLGMLLLLGGLLLRGATPPELAGTANTLLNYLALLFVPAGTGVITHLALLRSEWFPILVTLVLSAAITLLATGLTLKLLLRVMPAREGED